MAINDNIRNTIIYFILTIVFAGVEQVRLFVCFAWGNASWVVCAWLVHGNDVVN